MSDSNVMLDFASQIKAMVKSGVNPTDIAKMYLAHIGFPPNVMVSRLTVSETVRFGLAMAVNRNRYKYTSLNCGVLESMIKNILELRISVGDKGREDLMRAYNPSDEESGTVKNFVSWLKMRGGSN